MSCSMKMTVRPSSSRRRFDVLEDRLGERRVYAGHRLVEHDDVGFDHQGSSHLEELALAARERPRVLIGHVRHAETVEESESLLFDLAFAHAPAAEHGAQRTSRLDCQ